MSNASLTLTIEPLTEDKLKALVESIAAAITPAGGYKLGDGNRDGAQIVNGECWQPEYGCDSLGMTLDAIRARLVSAIGSWYAGCCKVTPGESPATPPARAALAAAPEGEGGVVEPSDEELLRLMPERWTAPAHAAAAIQAGALSYARVVWAAAAAAHQIQPAPLEGVSHG